MDHRSKNGSMRFALMSWIPAIVFAGCAGMPHASRPPVALVSHVDLPRFMGDWFVIANIPTFLEKGVRNAVDTYRLDADGTVDTTFSFNAKGADGPRKSYTSRGFVMDRATSAVWGQQYIWPFKADYRISYLSDDYTLVVITREKRDYVWIMARTPTISASDYERLVLFIGTQGYDVSRLQRVPQGLVPESRRK